MIIVMKTLKSHIVRLLKRNRFDLQVMMQNLATGEEFEFRCGRWMSRDEDDCDIWREIPARGPGIKKPLPGALVGGGGRKGRERERERE